MQSKLAAWIGGTLQHAGDGLLRQAGIQETWIDVGAHWGETTISIARHNPGLRIYAFEPNLRAAAKLMDGPPNFKVIPMAVAERNGCANFHINAFDAASSLLALNEDGVRSWEAASVLKVESVDSVPTIRLDTFMDRLGIKKVDFLKIDAQGTDLSVVKSAGERINDIAKIVLEVWVTPKPIYSEVPTKGEVVAYMLQHGFDLVATEIQSEGHEENLTFTRR